LRADQPRHPDPSLERPHGEYDHQVGEQIDHRRRGEGFEDPEDRQKVLRVVYEEFRRDYSSVIA